VSTVRLGHGRVPAILAAGLLAATLGGCLDGPAATSLPTPTRAPDPTPVVTAYELGVTAWYEGLLVHVDRAVATLDARGGPVEVSLRVENPGTDDGELDGGIRLAIGGTVFEPTRDSTVPLIPALGVVSVRMTYDLQAVASADRAILEIGDTPQHVALVPFTPDAGGPALFEPQSLDLSGAATAVDLRVALRGGLLRWDLPDWSQELDASLQALTLTYDATYTGTFAGGFAFTGDNIALRLPDGTIVLPRRDGHSQSIELIGPKKTKKGLFTRFEIPAGMTGEFSLLVRNGSTEKAIKFTIGG